MQEIGITIPRLQEIYDRLFKSKVCDVLKSSQPTWDIDPMLV